MTHKSRKDKKETLELYYLDKTWEVLQFTMKKTTKIFSIFTKQKKYLYIFKYLVRFRISFMKHFLNMSHVFMGKLALGTNFCYMVFPGHIYRK